MTDILQVLLGLALVNYLMFDVVTAEATQKTASVQLKTAIAIASTTAVAFLPTVVLSALFEQFVLSRFMQSFLSTVVFIVILAGVLQSILPPLLKRHIHFAAVPGVLLPLIFINCVVTGVTMPLRTSNIELGDVLVSGVARCVGFALILVLFTVLRERLTGADIPAAFRGMPATLLTAALVSMTFMGFTGLA